jgi:FAD/FMN-containing dehydrogenase
VELPPSPTTLPIPRLRAAFDGRVIAPDDPGYDQARSVFYRSTDHHPGVIVRPADAAQVVQVVTLARESGLPLAVRSGGHSLAGHGAGEGDHSAVSVMACALGR